MQLQEKLTVISSYGLKELDEYFFQTPLFPVNNGVPLLILSIDRNVILQN
jgi:hypothetical protein